MNDCTPIPCDCIDGPQGAQGLIGVTGNQGATGSEGVQGAIGDQGNQGAQGEQGIDGIQGLPGVDGTGNEGDQGPQGPKGLLGYQGADGDNGNAGANGTDGADFQAPFNIYHNEYCACGQYPFVVSTLDEPDCLCCFPCGNAYATSGGPGVLTHWNDRTGPGFSRVELINNPPVGTTTNIYSFLGAASYTLRAINTAITSVEITAISGTGDNIAFAGPQGAPHPESGLQFESPNGSDCITILYTGDGEYVVVKALLAGGVSPTVII
jgi:hypothetical protein